MAGIFQDLWGTTKNYFKLGIAGVRLKDSSGNLVIRNNGDSADAEVTASRVNVSGPDLILDSDGNALTVSRNASQSGALQVIYPPGKGSDGQVMRQKASTGAGVIEFEWASASDTSMADKLDTTSLAFGSTSPVSMFATGASDIIEYIEFIVDTPFDGAPSVSIGIAGQTSKYMATTEVDLTATAGTKFMVNPGKTAQGAESLIMTYSAGGATAGAARAIVHYASPA